MRACGVPSAQERMTPGCSYLEVSSGNVATHAQGRGTLARDVGKRQSEEAALGRSQCPTTGKQAWGALALPHCPCGTQSCCSPMTAPKGTAQALPTTEEPPWAPEGRGWALRSAGRWGWPCCLSGR